MKSTKGFTLIELLITTAILLAVMSLAMFGYRLYTEQWSRNLSNIEITYEEYRTNELISSALHGIVPYLVNRDKEIGFYFLGRAEGFTAVTQAALFNPSHLAVIRVFAEQEARGTYRLMYEEASLENTFLLESEQVLPFTQSIVVASGLPFIQFNYYGISGTKEHAANEGGTFIAVDRAWLNQYDGLKLSHHPEKLSINMGGYILYTTIASRAVVLKNRSLLDGN